MGQIFDEINRQLRANGMLKDVFTFVDATALTSKLNVWEERDKAIQAGYEKFNNEVAEKENFASDKDARFGAKSKNKYWFGFKETNSVDMQSGLINKVAVTLANVPDSEAGKRVLPRHGIPLFLCCFERENRIFYACFDSGDFLIGFLCDIQQPHDDNCVR